MGRQINKKTAVILISLGVIFILGVNIILYPHSAGDFISITILIVILAATIILLASTKKFRKPERILFFSFIPVSFLVFPFVYRILHVLFYSDVDYDYGLGGILIGYGIFGFGIPAVLIFTKIAYYYLLTSFERNTDNELQTQTRLLLLLIIYLAVTIVVLAMPFFHHL